MPDSETSKVGHPQGARPLNFLLISGSVRANSTNTAALKTAQALVGEHVEATLFDGLTELPYFDPDLDHDPLPVAVQAFRAQVHAADGLLFSTPEYAGPLPGVFKNMLEWTIGDADPLVRERIEHVLSALGREGPSRGLEFIR